MDLRREVKKGTGFQSVIIVILLLCIIALGTVVFMFFNKNDAIVKAPNTELGVVKQGEINGLQTPQNPNADEVFQYKINKSIYLKKADDPAEIMLENSSGNNYLMWAEYQIRDSGEVILTTEKLKPNEYIDMDKFEYDIPKGTYDVTVSMMIEDISTFELITVVEENIKLYIDEKPEGGK